MIREPAVSGQFYPSDPSLLKKQIELFLKGKKFDKNYKAKGLMLPHAGYSCSGEVAAETIANFNLADVIVILGTRHTYFGKNFGLSSADSWQTPLGNIETDKEFSRFLLKTSKHIEKDDDVHAQEHSIEVQLPLLKYIKGDFKIVPIVISPAETGVYEIIADDIIRTAKELNKDITIIASSDLTHYEPQEQAKKKDEAVIKAILELNAKELIEKVRKFTVSMCGYAPTYVMLEAVKKLGAKSAELIKYQTSGDVLGDYLSVVGYAGIGIY